MTEPAGARPHHPIPQQFTPAPAVPAGGAAEEEVPWARQSTHHKPQTARARRQVRDLPSWDPPPPGEILVNRRRRD
ncbi:hypothetical protein [Actinoplanes siamensis]|uniref:Uncharacterized protein n=1 Tax=Actinoplanes siamensis TaxID=1223317 RepID=A0A919TJK0_9ACTN|nr:hypothetical protein [Actinoplanes siamensis]GIF05196.1 hypothetical protein Asi03nite_27340 [Actinoplanes siamensis]